ncbi:MAG: protein kinase [Myxococcaceae bacterium]|nr:protein kinase [Myxococcaceae bacterium]
MKATGDPDLLIGRELGDYTVLARLGEGGMGVIYEGEQRLIHKKVAIKVLNAELSQSMDEVRRLLDEARAVNAIGHRGIVDIFSAGTLPEGAPYLVMELLAGQSLEARLKAQGPLPVLEALELMIEILDALGAAHAVGIVHRDLKPSNVMVVTPAHGAAYTKLLDFGLAKRHATRPDDNLTRAGSVMGTPTYMAPEQCRAEPCVPQTDLYAAGVMLFELISGRAPFQAENLFDLMALHVKGARPSLRASVGAVPPELDALVRSMMAKVPAERPSSAAQVRDALIAIRDRLRAAPVRPQPRPGRPAMPLLLAGAVALAVVVGGVLWLRSPTPAPAATTPVASPPELPEAPVVSPPAVVNTPEVVAPVVAHPPPAGTRPVAANGRAELLARIERHLQTLNERATRGERVDPLARTSLSALKGQVADPHVTTAELREDLRSLEKTYRLSP